ncbi:MAG: cyclic nucleotide-binding domain-containing protein [Mariprofundaceae bacterium]
MSIDMQWLQDELFQQQFSEGEKEALTCLEEVTFERYETIIGQNKPGGTLYFLKSGSATVEDNNDGMRVKIADLSAGTILGELSFLNNQNTTAEVMASEQCVVYKLSRDNFSILMREQQDLAYALLSLMLASQNNIIKRMNGELLPILRSIKEKAQKLPLIIKLFPIIFIIVYCAAFFGISSKDFDY